MGCRGLAILARSSGESCFAVFGGSDMMAAGAQLGVPDDDRPRGATKTNLA